LEDSTLQNKTFLLCLITLEKLTGSLSKFYQRCIFGQESPRYILEVTRIRIRTADPESVSGLRIYVHRIRLSRRSALSECFCFCCIYFILFYFYFNAVW